MMGKAMNVMAGVTAVIFVVIIVSAIVYVAIPKPEPENNERVTVKRELPDVCDKVLSTDSLLYPTADECATLLFLDLYTPCINDITLSESEREACMDRLDYALEENCRTMEKSLGIDFKVCIIDSLKRVYQQTGGS